tara:strand:+ start:68 stop:490 length:423 start_codon:yes stop_codon:yes gene_type:complete
MRIYIGEVLTSLGVENFVLDGEPTNEIEFNSSFKKIVGAKGDQAVMSSDPSTFGVTWDQVKTKYDELVSAEPLKILREERNKRLAETDWTQGRDVTLSNDTDWKTYRQALRDLPSKTTPKLDSYGELDMSSVTWPTKPSP